MNLPSKKRRGQNITEYLILVAGVLTVVILSATSKGIFTQGVNKSIAMMFDSVDDVLNDPCAGGAVNGGWSSWEDLGCNSGCTRQQARYCTNPAPRCLGNPCVGGDGAVEIATLGAEGGCTLGVWSAGDCAPGSCNGACGGEGTCPIVVTCSNGLCCGGVKPDEFASCTMPWYEWEIGTGGWGYWGGQACSPSYGPGVEGRSVTCPDTNSCCQEPKPPSRRACTLGCPAKEMPIGVRHIGDTTTPPSEFIKTFGPIGNGQSMSFTCPAGYAAAGNPTSICTATVVGNCMGDDSFDPNASENAGCYNINWSAVNPICVKTNCEESASYSIGGGLEAKFPATLFGQTAQIQCSNYRLDGVGYTGTATLDCIKVENGDGWDDSSLNKPPATGCIPNCPAQTGVDVGSGQTGDFRETDSGQRGTSSCPCGYQGNPQKECVAGAWQALIPGTECKIRQCGAPAGERFSIAPNPPVMGTFGPVNHLQTATVDCKFTDPRLDVGRVSKSCDWCTYAGTNGWGSTSGQCTAAPCVGATLSVGAGQTGFFPTTNHGLTGISACPSGYTTGVPSPPSRVCSYGDWGALANACRLYQCMNPITLSNATRCSLSGDSTDETGLSADTNWSLANSACTSTKCEWRCNAGYIKSGSTCVLAVCTGSAFLNASMCSGDGTMLAVDTPRTLVNACSAPAGSAPKCQYTCNSGYVLYNGSCCQPKTCSEISSSYVSGGINDMRMEDGCGGTIYCKLSCVSNCGGAAPLCCGTRDICGNVCSSGSGCKADKNGTWGGPSNDQWEDVGTCQSCKQQQRQICVGTECNGTCPGSAQTRSVECESGGCYKWEYLGNWGTLNGGVGGCVPDYFNNPPVENTWLCMGGIQYDKAECVYTADNTIADDDSYCYSISQKPPDLSRSCDISDQIGNYRCIWAKIQTAGHASSSNSTYAETATFIQGFGTSAAVEIEANFYKREDRITITCPVGATAKFSQTDGDSGDSNYIFSENVARHVATGDSWTRSCIVCYSGKDFLKDNTRQNCW